MESARWTDSRILGAMPMYAWACRATWKFRGHAYEYVSMAPNTPPDLRAILQKRQARRPCREIPSFFPSPAHPCLRYSRAWSGARKLDDEAPITGHTTALRRIK